MSGRRRNKRKQGTDSELVLMKSWAKDPDHALSGLHGMRIPVAKMFCSVFYELADFAAWTRHLPEPDAFRPAYMNLFRSLCNRDFDRTPYQYYSECREFWHIMTERPASYVNADLHSALWEQIRELGTMHVSKQVIWANLNFAMALHPRLGADSPVRVLEPELIQTISGMLRPKGMVLWMDALFAT